MTVGNRYNFRRSKPIVDEELRDLDGGIAPGLIAVEGEEDVETLEGFQPFPAEALRPDDPHGEATRLSKGQGIGRPFANEDGLPLVPCGGHGVDVVGNEGDDCRLNEAKILPLGFNVSPLYEDRLALVPEGEEKPVSVEVKGFLFFGEKPGGLREW